MPLAFQMPTLQEQWRRQPTPESLSLHPFFLPLSFDQEEPWVFGGCDGDERMSHVSLLGGCGQQGIEREDSKFEANIFQLH